MRLIDRQHELAFFHSLLQRQRPGPAQLILLYGRRRVGKTLLLRTWAEQSGLPYTYWAAEKEPAALQRRKLYARLLGVSLSQAPTFGSWSELWEAAANLLGSQRRILILDELPYAAEADPATLSALQHAWDQYFQHGQLIIVLCGSQVRVMETLLSRQSPLFGRMTGQWHLQPLPYATLREFFPDWSAEERVAAYAVVGGIPAYLEWLDPKRSLSENIRHVILAPGSMFVAEPQFLLYDEVREPQTYLAILKAIGAGNHTAQEISNASLVGSAHLAAYLAALQELRLVERRLPATTPAAERRTARKGRYHLSDPYFRFYFRFVAPYHEILELEPDRVLESVRQGMRAFVGQTAFEQLAQEWVIKAGRSGRLAWRPTIAGSHWSRRVQVDVVAANWEARELFLGECKWTGEVVGRETMVELLEEKTPKVLADMGSAGAEWRVQHGLFSRRGFSDAVRTEAQQAGMLLVDLEQMDSDLTNS